MACEPRSADGRAPTSASRRDALGGLRRSASARPVLPEEENVRSADRRSREAVPPREGRRGPRDGRRLARRRARSIVVLLGPSGCGKTTLLRCIAGLEQPDGGEIGSRARLSSTRSAGSRAARAARGQDDVPVVRALAAHDGLQERRVPAQVRGAIEGARSRSASSSVLDARRHRAAPRPVPGADERRPAAARRARPQPRRRAERVLFDEPLSNVDAKVREQLRVELLAMQQRARFAGVYVTHDQDEAMAISDRIVVMDDGQDRCRSARRRRSTASPSRASSRASSGSRTCGTGRSRRGRSAAVARVDCD